MIRTEYKIAYPFLYNNRPRSVVLCFYHEPVNMYIIPEDPDENVFVYDKIINPILKSKLNGDYIDYFNKNNDNKLILNNVKETYKNYNEFEKEFEISDEELNEINGINIFENNNIEEKDSNKKTKINDKIPKPILHKSYSLKTNKLLLLSIGLILAPPQFNKSSDLTHRAIDVLLILNCLKICS